MGKNKTTHTELWYANFKESDRLDDLDILVQGTTLLKWALKKWHGRKENRFIWLWTRTSADVNTVTYCTVV